MLSAINVCRVCFIGALVFFYSLEASGTAAFAQIGAIGTLPQFDVTHLAGGPGGAGYLDGPASQARFSGPSGIWGSGGNLYVANSGERTIRRVAAATGEVTTLATLDTNLTCNGPLIPGGHVSFPLVLRYVSLWADSANVYAGDFCLHVIYKISIASGEVAVLSGQLTQFATINGPAADARFTFPLIMWGDDSYLWVLDGTTRRVDKQTSEVTSAFPGITGIVGGDGTYLYCFQNLSSSTTTVQMVRIATGDITTVGTYPPISTFWGLPVWRHSEGDEDFLYVMNTTENTIKKIRVSTGEMTAFAGGIGTPNWKDGPGAAASFYWPWAAWGDSDYLYVVELSNHTLRKIRFSTGEVTTLAGRPAISGSSDGAGITTRFNSPEYLWGDGNYLYVTEVAGTIRRVRISDGQVSTLAGIPALPVYQNPSADGIGTTARFNVPWGIWGDRESLYVVERRGCVLQSSGTSNPISFEIGTAPDNTNTAFAIGSRGAFSAISAEQFGAASVGYARLESVPGTQPPAGFAIYGYRAGGVLVSEAAVPAAGLVQTGRISFDSTGAANTGVAILNPNGVPVRLSYTMNRPDGSQFFQGSTDLAPGQQLSRFLNEFPYWGGSPDIQGTFSFTASSPVSVIALGGFVNERSEFLMSALPIVDLAARADQALAFPHIADAGGWSSRITLTNPTDQVLAGRLQFLNPAGQPLSIVLDGQTGSDFDYSIPAKASRTFVTANTSPDVRVGWIRVVATAGANYPSGVLIFSYKPANVVVTEAAVAAIPTSSAFRLYVEKNNAIRTGFAIANPGAAIAQVTYELTDLNGDAGFIGFSIRETCSGNVPLPLGEGGAERRVRAGNAPSSGPSGHLLPGGEGHEPLFRLIWTPLPCQWLDGDIPLNVSFCIPAVVCAI